MIDFEDFRETLDATYEAMNKDLLIRIDPPNDTDKLHMMVAIESYFALMQDQIAQSIITNMFMDYEDEDEDWDDMLR